MISERLKQLRKSKNITQAELAKEMNVAKTTIASYEQGVSEPNIAMMTKLAKYFNVSPSYLMGWEPIIPNTSGQLPLLDDITQFPLYTFEYELIKKYRELSIYDQQYIGHMINVYPKLTEEYKENINSLLDFFSKQSSKIASLEQECKELKDKISL